MRFETFSCYKRTEKTEENSSLFGGRFDILKLWEEFWEGADSEEESVVEYASRDKQEFAVILCHANPRDESLRGQKLALELGSEVMKKYVENAYGFNRHEAFRKMCQEWKNTLANAYGIVYPPEKREKLFQQYAPSFFAIGGSKDKLLIVQCGDGCFMIEKDHKIDEFYLSKENNDEYEKGFSGQRLLYFREYNLKSVKKNTHFIPDKAVMVVPYKTNRMRNRFENFVDRTEKMGFENRSDYLDYCLEPLNNEIKDMAQRRIQTLIAGYWTIGKRSTSKPDYGPQYTEQRDPGYSGKTVSPQKKTPSWSENFLKKQEQKRQEQRQQELKKLNDERYTLEAELQQLKKMQSNMQKQQQNLKAEHEMTVKWVQAQRKYLDSKKALNHSPHD